MQNDPTTQLLWRTREESVERHRAFDPKGSRTRRTHDVSMLETDASRTPVTNVSKDLELGAHVLRMQTFGTLRDSSPELRPWTPLATPRALPTTWETA